MDHRTWTAHKNLPMQLWDQCVKFQKPMQKRLQPRCALRRHAPATPRTRSQKPATSAGKKETKWREMEGMGGQLRIFTDGLPCGAGFGVRISTCLLCASSESVLRAQDAHRCVSDMRDPAYLVSEAWTHLETAQNRPFRVCCLRADLLEAVGLARKRGGSGWAERAVGRHFRDSHPMLAFGLFTFCIYN